MELWMTAGDASSYRFIKKFYPIWKKLNKEEVDFQPHYLTWYLPGSKESGGDGNP